MYIYICAHMFLYRLRSIYVHIYIYIYISLCMYMYDIKSVDIMDDEDEATGMFTYTPL
jgi:hypothetical protein